MNEQSEVKETKKEENRDKRKRSPNHPVVNLELAIQRTTELYQHDSTHQVPIDLLHERWGGLAKMGGYLLQLVGALKAYGLIEVEGQKENRKIRVSQTAVRIIEGAPDKDELIKKVAIEPSIYKEIWTKYEKVGLPKDDVLDRVLRWGEEGLDIQISNKQARELLIKNFTETLKFAKLIPNGTVKKQKLETDEIIKMNNVINEEQVNPKTPPPTMEEFATMQIPNVGMLRLLYPVTKKKLDMIRKLLDAMEVDLE